MAWYRRALNVLRPGRLQRDLERELSFHVAERRDALEAEGLSAAEAERLAREQFGHYPLQVERTRDVDVIAWFDTAVRNVRHAIRGLRRAPVFSATIVLTLALGIGANSAVFSAIDAVLLRPLPFPESDRLMLLSEVDPKVPHPALAPVRLEEWNRLNKTFEAITGFYIDDVSELSGELPEKLTRALVAPRFLQVLRVEPSPGRTFSPPEERFGGPAAVLISSRLWSRRFGGDPGVVGRTLRVGRTLYTIVGVMPPTFAFPTSSVDLWAPSPMDAPYAQSREATWFTAIGRLSPGATLEQARADLAAVQAGLGREYPQTDAMMTAEVQPLKETAIAGVRRSLWILFGSVSLVLVIACTNVTALLLSRAAGRQAEIALRVSLGASRRAVAALALTEALILSLAGAAAGLLIAASASRIFHALAAGLPRVEEMALDWRIVLYTLGCGLAATLLCGLAPASSAARRNLSSPLAQASRSQVSRRHPVQFALVAVQVALAVTLLAGAGLLLRSLQELNRVSPGFDPSRVLTFNVSTSWGETADQPAARRRVERLLEGLRALPGIRSMAAAVTLPGVPTDYAVEMQVAEGYDETGGKIVAQARWVTASYFGTVGIPVLAGELCRDDEGVPALMVNRRFAETYLPGTTAIGRHLTLTSSVKRPPAEIRGIVGDARETGLDRNAVATVYWCGFSLQPGTYFLARTDGDPRSLVEAVRRRIHELEPARSVYGLVPLDAQISEAYGENRLRTILLAIFALTAVSLACIGLYGTLSYLVATRQREIALRLALGAQRGQVVAQFLSHGLRITLIGIAAGLTLAAALSRLLSGMLYGVSAGDPVALVGVIALILAVSAAAATLPAVRAARLDPMRVLREE